MIRSNPERQILGNCKNGWSKREISIVKPVYINGQIYVRLSEEIHDPLYATALCIDGRDGQNSVVS